MLAARCSLIGLLLVLLTLGEVRLLDRLLYVDAAQYGFVLANVEGVLTGRPVSKSWQQRVLAPLGVRALDGFTHDRLAALKLFGALSLGATNLLLFAIARRRGNALGAAVGLTGAFGFAHLLLLYKLEYPWDGVDVLLFLLFGSAASGSRKLLSNWAWLLLGVLNHETILYLPLWYLLEPLEAPAAARAGARGRWLGAFATLLLMAAAIGGLRAAWYVGRPDLPADNFERATPLIENHWHVVHNLQQWFWFDWREGRVFIAASLTLWVAWLFWQLRRPALRRAAAWSLIVLSSIVAFGYVNETRHYLVLLAFWFGYRCPVLHAQCQMGAQGLSPDRPMPSG